ncbi:MAG: AMP-binding protein, partial [Pseudonocardia sp.]|nr:AMP-binding protein [Pseudonocardia sp.]
MSFRSTYPDVEIPDTSIYEFLFADFGDRADEPALIDGTTGSAITFAQLRGLVDKIAAGLRARGIGKGDVVALFAPNNPYWVAAFHGVLRANAVVTSANSLYTAAGLVHPLRDAGARMIITVSPFLDRAA